MRKSLCELRGLRNSYKCFIDEGIPYFEVGEAIKIMQDYNRNCKFPIHYNEEKDAFWQPDVRNQELHIWKGKNYNTNEGVKHLYNIKLGGM